MGGYTLHHQRHAPREAEGLRWCLGTLCMGMSMSRRNMTVDQIQTVQINHYSTKRVGVFGCILISI